MHSQEIKLLMRQLDGRWYLDIHLLNSVSHQLQRKVGSKTGDGK